MRVPSVVLALALVVSGLLPGRASADAAVQPPDFTLRALAGGNHRLSEHRGEVVMVLFWASWCGTCRAALERADELAGTYGPAGLKVLAVNMDERPETAQSFAAAAGVRYPVLFDADKSVSRSWQADRLPLYVLVDRAGTVRARNGAGDGRAARQLVDDIRRLLDE